LRPADSADESVATSLTPGGGHAARPTTVTRLGLSLDSTASSDANDVTFSVPSTSVPSQLQSSVVSTMNTEQCSISPQSASYRHLSTTRQVALHSTSHGQLDNLVQQPTHCQSQLAYPRLDVLPSCITASAADTVTVRPPACVTTSSSSGRGGLSAYDSSRQRVNSESVEGGLVVLRPHWDSHGHSQATSRPPASSSQQRITVTRGLIYKTS